MKIYGTKVSTVESAARINDAQQLELSFRVARTRTDKALKIKRVIS